MGLSETAHLLEFAVRVDAGILSGAASVARRYPLPAAGLLIGAAYIAWRSGCFSGECRNAVGYQLRQAAREGLGPDRRRLQRLRQARGALLVVEPYGVPTVEQLAARYLGPRRCGPGPGPAAGRS
jgi:hypothetical protein